MLWNTSKTHVIFWKFCYKHKIIFLTFGGYFKYLQLIVFMLHTKKKNQNRY